MRTAVPRLSILACIFLSAAFLRGEEVSTDWPHWRNADGNGVSNEKSLPLGWSEDLGVVFKCKLPEWGDSSPVIGGDGVFLTSHAVEKQLVLVKVDKATGEIAWARKIGQGSAERMPIRGKNESERRNQNFHEMHNMATPSPVTDGRVVVALFGSGDLAAYDMEGKKLWQRNMQAEHGQYTVWWGYGNSPVLHGDLVVVVAMQDSCADLSGKPVESYVAAYDKLTGKPVWKTIRPTEAKREACDSYTTPIVRRIGDRTEMIVHGGQVLDAYDPATGKRLWHLPGLVGVRPVSGPVAVGDTIYLTQGMRRPMLAVRTTGKGKLTEKDIVWTLEKGACDCPTPVVAAGRVYMVTDNGIAQCLDARDGRVLWKQRLEGAYKASPLVAGGRVYLTNTDGLTTVLAASKKFKRLAENKLDDTIIASPAVGDGKLYIRGKKRLYCIGK